LQSEQRSLSAVLESNGHKLKEMPLTLYYGATATDSLTNFNGRSQAVKSTGLRLRGQFDAWHLDNLTSLNTSFTASQQWGSINGLSEYVSLGLNREMPWGSMALNYEYSGDSTLASVASGGRQRMSLDTDFGSGRTNVHFLASRSLDTDWTSFYGDMSYRISGLFNFSAGYTLDKYLTDQSLDYDLMFSYRVGVREVGVIWSKKTHRLGLEILGARF